MTYVKIDRLDLPGGDAPATFEGQRPLDRSIASISRVGGYVMLFIVTSALVIAGALFL